MLGKEICGVCLYIILLSQSAFSQATLQQILDNGPRENRINVVYLSEGYTSDQLSKFIEHADYWLSYMLDRTHPFSHYKTYFNGFAISVASVDSGSDHPAQNIYRDTYFNSTYGTGALQRLITVDGEGDRKIDSLLQHFIPDYDIVILIVNDPEYGGSGGTYAITSTHGAGPDVAVHEIGHSFAGLADEYEYTLTADAQGESLVCFFDPFSYKATQEPANITQETVRGNIRWRSWILDSTPIPTPEIMAYSQVVGLFEGANYQTTGWYRPRLNCEMRAIGSLFCEICSEQFLKSIYERITPIDFYLPPNLNIELSDSQSIILIVVPLEPLSHQLKVQWFVNDSLLNSVNTPFLNIYAQDLGSGSHQVKAKVIDTTIWVKNDPDRLLSDSVVWTVNISGPCTDIAGDANGDGNILLSDLVAVVNFLFKGAPAPAPICRADANGNGIIELPDIIYLVNFLFRSGPAPIKTDVCCL